MKEDDQLFNMSPRSWFYVACGIHNLELKMKQHRKTQGVNTHVWNRWRHFFARAGRQCYTSVAVVNANFQVVELT